MHAARSLEDRRPASPSEVAGGEEDAGDGGRESPRDGQGEQPGEDDVAEEPPVDALARAHPADEHDGAHLTMGGADWDAHLGGQKDRRSRSNLDREAIGRRHFGEVLAQGLDDPSAPDPETQADAHSSVEENVNGRLRVLEHIAVEVDHPKRDQGTNGIADVVAAVRKRPEHGREDLEEREQLGCLWLVIVLVFFAGRHCQGSLLNHDQ